MIYHIVTNKNVGLICDYEFDYFEAAVLEDGVQVEPEWPARVRITSIKLDTKSAISDDFIKELEKQILEDNHQ